MTDALESAQRPPKGDLSTSVHAATRKRHVIKRAVQLVFLAVIADLAVLLVELAAGLDPFITFQQRPILYVYLFLGTIVAFGTFGAVLGSREAQLEEMAIRDSLTGLFNSRYLQARLRQELANGKRHRNPTAFALFDIDHFKQVNDTHGHPVGDRMLQRIGEAILSTLRQGETAARVGGEEFALLLPRTPAGGAAAAVDRFRRAIGQATVDNEDGQSLAVTVSAGVACSVDDDVEDAATLYSRADQALYQAKRQGRDRVVIGISNSRFSTEGDGVGCARAVT